MSFTFSLWGTYLVLGIMYWPLTLLLALGFAAIAGFARKARKTVRILCALAAAFFALPLLWALGGIAGDMAEQARDRRERQAHTWVLAQDTTLAGVRLAAGSRLLLYSWFDMQQKEQLRLSDIDEMDLARPAVFLGAELAGRVQQESGTNRWYGMLSKAQTVKGWPCTGNIRINGGDSMPIELTLAADYSLFGQVFPKGTVVRLYYQDWQFDFPGNGRSMNFDPGSGKCTFDSERYDTGNNTQADTPRNDVSHSNHN